MAYEVSFSADAERDFELIFEFLFESYLEFGEAIGPAIDRAEERIQSIRTDIEALAKAPHRGTVQDDILPGLRHVTLGRAVIWFDIVEEEDAVQILAIFFGGQCPSGELLSPMNRLARAASRWTGLALLMHRTRL